MLSWDARYPKYQNCYKEAHTETVVDSINFAIVTKAGANEGKHLRKRFLTLFYNLSLTLRYAFHFELQDSRAFSRNLRVTFREIQNG
nr:unnamed protein product [Callosobruchus chinensis]